MSSSTHIVSRLATRFKQGVEGGGDNRDKPDYLTRDIGGHWRTNMPYISGYFQVIFGLPSELLGGEQRAGKASQWMHSTCEGFTPHNQTLNKVDVMGQGQIGSSYPASVTTTREITFTFREYQNLPIMNIIRRWASVFDPFTGVSPLDGNRFIPANYKGWVAVAQTKPVGSFDRELSADDIEEAYIYHGIFPTNIPVDTASAEDITANDVVQLSSTFSFDGAPLTSAEPGVTDKVVELLAGMQYIGQASGNDENSTYNRYWYYGVQSDATSQWGSHDDGVDTKSAPEGTASPETLS